MHKTIDAGASGIILGTRFKWLNEQARVGNRGGSAGRHTISNGRDPNKTPTLPRGAACSIVAHTIAPKSAEALREALVEPRLRVTTERMVQRPRRSKCAFASPY
jgi:hypothetical protein